MKAKTPFLLMEFSDKRDFFNFYGSDTNHIIKPQDAVDS